MLPTLWNPLLVHVLGAVSASERGTVTTFTLQLAGSRAHPHKVAFVAAHFWQKLSTLSGEKPLLDSMWGGLHGKKGKRLLVKAQAERGGTCTARCSLVAYSWRCWAQTSHWLKALRRVRLEKKDRATRAPLFSSTDSCHCLQHCNTASSVHVCMQHNTFQLKQRESPYCNTVLVLLDSTSSVHVHMQHNTFQLKQRECPYCNTVLVLLD